LSILFIKYYPQYGRAYHMGMPMFTGVAMQKNTLGKLCLLTGIFCIWNLVFNQNRPITLVGRRLRVEWILLAMVGWLLYMADSATSLACLLVALFVIGVSHVPVVRRGPHRILGLGAVLLFMAIGLEWLVDLSGSILTALGRDSDLTTRVPMWDDLLGTMNTFNLRFFGVGFEIFWETRQGAFIFDKWNVFNAHNGYLDTYLSLGYVGVFVLLAGIVSTVPKIARHLSGDRAGAILRLTLLVVAMLYNWTESAFKSVDNMWLLFFLISIEPPVLRSKSAPSVNLAQAKRRGLSAA
jgi:hypothetical protein